MRPACRSAWLLLAMIGLSLPGCRGSAPADRGPVPITITNTLGQGSAAIFVVSGAGAGRLIGTVNYPETTTLIYEGPTVAQRLRLRAIVGGNREILSEAFIIPSNARAEWDLRTNRVTTPSNRDAPPPG